jgi:hypothetical protein
MADKPTEWLTAKIRINVSRSDGGRAASYGWTVRDITVPTKPALPDHVDVEVVKNRQLTLKCHPLTWDAHSQEYWLPDATIVLTSADIASLHAAEPTQFRKNPE